MEKKNHILYFHKLIDEQMVPLQIVHLIDDEQMVPLIDEQMIPLQMIEHVILLVAQIAVLNMYFAFLMDSMKIL